MWTVHFHYELTSFYVFLLQASQQGALDMQAPALLPRWRWG